MYRVFCPDSLSGIRHVSLNRFLRALHRVWHSLLQKAIGYLLDTL
jgi:hypothetical protein